MCDGLTRAQAVEIFVEHYFRRPGIAALPEALQASVFDMYVNAGVERGEGAATAAERDGLSLHR